MFVGGGEYVSEEDGGSRAQARVVGCLAAAARYTSAVGPNRQRSTPDDHGELDSSDGAQPKGEPDGHHEGGDGREDLPKGTATGNQARQGTFRPTRNSDAVSNIHTAQRLQHRFWGQHTPS